MVNAILRSLKLDIILNMEELLKSLVEEGKRNQQQAAERTNSIKEERFVSTDTNREPPHDTINKIAEMSGTSRATVGRVKRLKKGNKTNFIHFFLRTPPIMEGMIKNEVV